MLNLENLSLAEVAKIIIPGLIAFFSGRHIARRSIDTSVSHDSFHSVYNPIYKTIQPYLYKGSDDKSELIVVLKMIQSIAKKNNHLILEDFEPEVKELIGKIQDDKEYSQPFDLLCLSIESSHRKLKMKLGYPIQRRVFYHVQTSSMRRFKARVKRLDFMFAEFMFIIAGIFLFVLTSSILYNLMVDFINWGSSLFPIKIQ